MPDTERPTREQVDAALGHVDLWRPGTSTPAVLAAEVRALRADLDRVHSALRHESDAHIAERSRLRAALVARTPQPADDVAAALMAAGFDPPPYVGEEWVDETACGLPEGHREIVTITSLGNSISGWQARVVRRQVDGSGETVESGCGRGRVYVEHLLRRDSTFRYARIAAPLPAVPDGEDDEVRCECGHIDTDHPGNPETGWGSCATCSCGGFQQGDDDAVLDGEDVPARLDAAADALDETEVEWWFTYWQTVGSVQDYGAVAEREGARLLHAEYNRRGVELERLRRESLAEVPGVVGGVGNAAVFAELDRLTAQRDAVLALADDLAAGETVGILRGETVFRLCKALRADDA